MANGVDALREQELIKLYQKLDALDVLDDEYEIVLARIHTLEGDNQKALEITNAADNTAKDRKSRWVTFGVGLVAGPVIDTIAKTFLASKICKMEQYDSFTSSAGRSISSWFKWNK